jgi:hypothetical protein
LSRKWRSTRRTTISGAEPALPSQHAIEPDELAGSGFDPHSFTADDLEAEAAGYERVAAAHATALAKATNPKVKAVHREHIAANVARATELRELAGSGTRSAEPRSWLPSRSYPPGWLG